MADARVGFAIVAACSSAASPPSSPGTGAATIETVQARGRQRACGQREARRGLVVYCGGVDAWPSDIADRQVMAYGTPIRDSSHAARLGPGGDLSQGTRGAIWVLQNCESGK